MGLFDDIEALTASRDSENQAEPTRQAASGITPGDPAAAPTPGGSTTGQTDTRRPPPQPRPAPLEIAERNRIMNRKPEQLSFLQPCPLCKGRAFIHIDGGGFVCRTCQPGFFGHPVEATGPDRPSPSPYTELHMANDSEPIGNLSLLTDHITEQQRAHFAAAWPWIKENMNRLCSAGWTRAALMRRAKFRWPYGPWGAAWLPVWNKPGVTVTIGQRGEIVFSFTSNGRIITQAAHKPTIKNNQKTEK